MFINKICGVFQYSFVDQIRVGQGKSIFLSYFIFSLFIVYRDVVLGQINGVDEAVDVFYRVGGV